MYTNSNDSGSKVISAKREMGMKTCGHPEGDALKGLSVETEHHLIYVPKISLAAAWV